MYSVGFPPHYPGSGQGHHVIVANIDTPDGVIASIGNIEAFVGHYHPLGRVERRGKTAPIDESRVAVTVLMHYESLRRRRQYAIVTAVGDINPVFGGEYLVREIQRTFRFGCRIQYIRRRLFRGRLTRPGEQGSNYPLQLVAVPFT
jgi:hypothetical protein